MVRIDGKAFGLFLPALTDVFIGGKPFERFESLRDVIGHQKGMEMLLQMLMGLVIAVFTVASLSVRFMRSTWPLVQGWLGLVSRWSRPCS